MNRSIVMFVVLFVGVFGSAYLMMQGNFRPAASSPTDSSTKPATSDVSQPKEEDAKSASAIATGDSKSLKGESNPSGSHSQDDSKPRDSDAYSRSARSSGDATTKNKQGENDQKVATIINYGGSSSRTSSKGKRISKRPPAITIPAVPAEPADNLWDEDLDRLQGTWQVIDGENEGEHNMEEAKHYTWDFQADKYTINYNGNFAELYTVKLNSGKSPKTIDSTHHIVGKTFKGIYEIKGDTLRICYDLTFNGRPDSFQTPKGSRRVCFILQRK